MAEYTCLGTGCGAGAPPLTVDDLPIFRAQLPVLPDGRTDWSYVLPNTQPTKTGWQFTPGTYTPTTAETLIKFAEDNALWLGLGAAAFVLAISVGGRKR